MYLKENYYLCRAPTTLSMTRKPNHNIRVTFRVSQEEYDMYRKIASDKGFGSVSSVIRHILQCRISVLRRLVRQCRISPDTIGDEIRQMFSNYEESGRGMEYPSDINKRL